MKIGRKEEIKKGRDEEKYLLGEDIGRKGMWMKKATKENRREGKR